VNLFMSLLILWVILLAQFLATAMFYALSNARKKTLKEHLDEGNARAGRTLDLLENSSALLVSEQYLSILFSMIGAVFVILTLVPWLSDTIGRIEMLREFAVMIAFLLVLPIFALITLLVGHQLPGAMISGRTEGLAMVITPTMQMLVWGLSPLMRFSQNLSQQIGILMGGSGNVSIVTEEEIKTLVDAGSQDGVIESEEKEMIYSVFKFSETVVREVMVPRIDIVALDIETSLDDALNKIIHAGHSRIPVYEETIDNIRGFLYAKDLLAVWHSKRGDFDMAGLLREAYFVPESKEADELLEEFQRRETHIAVVIDEYGGTAGLVTIEDLIEEIVGEIRDEYDFMEEAVYEQISETEYLCKAGIDLDDLNELLDIHLPTDENDTLGGYIFSELGRIPKVGEKVEYPGVVLEVVAVKGRRISKVRVTMVSKEREVDTATLSSEVETTAAK
jgi:putative hemolysin